MKRNLCLSALALLLCPLLFVSCAAPAEHAAVTPTETAGTVSKAAQPVAGVDSTPQSAASSTAAAPSKQAEPAKTAKQPAESSAPTAKPAAKKATAASSAAAKKPAASAAPDSSTVDVWACLPARDEVRFTAEADFQEWLLNGNQNPEAHQAMLSTLQSGQSVRYYAPRTALQSEQMKLVDIRTIQNAIYYTFHYCSAATGKEVGEVSIWQHRDEDHDFAKMYQEHLLAAQKGEENYGSREQFGSNYLWDIVPDSQAACIYWQKDGVTFSAYTGDEMANYLPDILPFLEVEPVTLRTDVVTE